MEVTEPKGPAIPQSAALAERLERALEKLEAALAASQAENLRLKRVEKAAGAALAELDALLLDGDPQPVIDSVAETRLSSAGRG